MKGPPKLSFFNPAWFSRAFMLWSMWVFPLWISFPGEFLLSSIQTELSLRPSSRQLQIEWHLSHGGTHHLSTRITALPTWGGRVSSGYSTCSRAACFNQGRFALQGPFSNVWRHFWLSFGCHNRGEVLLIRDAAQHPTVTERPPKTTTKNYLAPNVKSIKCYSRVGMPGFVSWLFYDWCLRHVA